MRNLAIITLCLVVAGCAGHGAKIATGQGELNLIPLSDNAVRVQVKGDLQTPQLQELVYTEKVRAPKFKKSQTDGGTLYSLKGISVEYRPAEDVLTFYDAAGKVILQETSHSIKASSVSGVPCYDVTQAFTSPADEHLYGTGQFQDGYLDIRSLSRRLTQVNTQIAIPMVLSSKGYALLWNNYGLTEFNPLSNCVEMKQVQTESDGRLVNVTGTLGNRREMRFNTQFEETLQLPEDGKYSILLDMGQTMSRKQYLAIDGEPVIDFTNSWLPPTASVIVDLAAKPRTPRSSIHPSPRRWISRYSPEMLTSASPRTASSPAKSPRCPNGCSDTSIAASATARRTRYSRTPPDSRRGAFPST